MTRPPPVSAPPLPPMRCGSLIILTCGAVAQVGVLSDRLTVSIAHHEHTSCGPQTGAYARADNSRIRHLLTAGWLCEGTMCPP